MYYVAAILLCLVAVTATLSHHEIHKRMTAEQVQGIFQTNHEDVPDYKIVQIDVSRMNKRDTRSRRSVKIVSFNDEVNLFLEPIDGMLAGVNTPVTIADTSSGYLQYVDLQNIMQEAGEIMHDRQTRSSFVVSKDSNQRYVLNGFIESRNLVVRSLPEELTHELSREARSVDNSVSFNNRSFHVIFPLKKQPSKPDHPNHHLNETRLWSALTRNKRAYGQRVAYPEMLLVVDYSTYIFHGSSVINVVRYLLALWNAADMRFRSLVRPKIRLNIARIIIAKTSDAAPYITYNMPNAKTVHAQRVFNDAGPHFYSQKNRIPLDSYDVLMMMTRKMLTTNGQDLALGYAIVGGACLQGSEQRQRIDSNGIFHDDGSYYAWGPAHEIGHLLGANHDDSNCPSRDGYVMTPAAMSNDNSWNFSFCSKGEIYSFLQNRGSQCLYNVPRNTGKLLSRIVPGSVMTIDEQCLMANNTGVCKLKGIYEEYNFCQQLICADRYNPNNCIVMWGHATAEGTRACNEGKGFCLAGQCII